MLPSFNLAIALIAVSLEATFGYPDVLYRLIDHPVVWIGALITRLERHYNQPTLPEQKRRLNGVIVVAIVLAAAMIPALLLQLFLLAVLQMVLGLGLVGLLCASLIAQASLYSHVRAVAAALDWGEVEAAREAVAKIVGRDVTALDESAIGRAAIESLAENFSDGVVAPVFWCALSGLPGIAGYKAVNTADSMIGHLNPRYAAFGWAAAKFDDVLNVLPSRLAMVLIAAAALLHRKTSGIKSFAAARRYAHRHRSPNAGWPEAAMAGALGLALGGPRHYGGILTDDGLIGDGRRFITPDDIYRALKLYCIACGLQIAVLAGLTGFIWLD